MVRVDGYSFGKIVIDGKEYNHDVIVYWDGKVEKWWRKEGHRVCLEDVKSLIDRKVKTAIFGTGKYGVMKVGDDVKEKFEEMGIECVERISDEAVKLFNELVSKKDKVALAIHLTC